MKKSVCLVFVLIVLLLLCGCGKKADSAASTGGASYSSGSFSYKTDKEYHKTYSNESGEWVVFSFRVTNTGKTPFFVRNAEWKIVDADGNPSYIPHQRAATPQVLYPGESAWFCWTKLIEGHYSIAAPQLTGVSANNRFDIRYLSVSDLRLAEEDGLPVAYGTVENTHKESEYTGYTKKMSMVYVNLYDQDGFLIGQLGWGSFNLDPGEKEEFKATLSYEVQDMSSHPTVALSSVASYEAIAYDYMERDG